MIGSGNSGRGSARDRARVAAAALSLSVCMGLATGSAAPRPGAQKDHARGDITLTVFAAASLNETFHRAADEFSAAHAGTSFIFNFAGSQQLAQQLVLGARADIFASADARQMKAAGPAIDSITIRVFVRNLLVVVVPSGAGRAVHRLADLGSPGVKIVLAANAVPAGEYALRFIGRCSPSEGFPVDFMSAVLRNVVSYEENVRAVLAKVVLAEADAGVVYVTDAASASRRAVDTVDIPERLNVIAEYPIARVRESAHPAEAELFIRFLLSARGQELLEAAGFTRAPAAAKSTDAKPADTESHPHE
ncbi:MAG TPA: molybdate ABC transporter substrate-binding protein [Bacteroidota bacterium]|nr:molybdate ABC transporter substrate-binding protein [Bacteroidota bacterium]